MKQDQFYEMADQIFSTLSSSEAASLSLDSEDSQFTRFNRSKVRQTGNVKQTNLQISLQSNNASSTIAVTLTGELNSDRQRVKHGMGILREDLSHLDQDPFLPEVKDHGSSEKNYSGRSPEPEELYGDLLAPARDRDLVGFFASGPLYRGMANSAGTRHWFQTHQNTLDYSLCGEHERAVKSYVSNREWSQQQAQDSIASAIKKLEALQRPPHAIKKGNYRAYLEPAALSDIMHMFSWHGLSEASYKQGQSALKRFREGTDNFSTMFNLRENFAAGSTPQFNSLGEVSPETVDLIQEGRFKSFLVSTKTAKEYDTPTNFAATGENLRAPEVLPGELAQPQILHELGTGLYLSNLHYLNWSDISSARITGMTRYACYWVENGQIEAPIENMRFDESLYTLMGEQLEGFSAAQEWIPEVLTYEQRHLGGAKLPGMLTGQFQMTL